MLADPDARLVLEGSGFEGCIEQLCALDNERVAAAHRAAIEAGAEVIRTVSLAANALRLRRWDLERHVGELNWLSAQIARSATRGTKVIVAARVGPSGVPFSETPMPELRELFLWQIGSLLDGGAQIVILDGFRDMRELEVALEIKQTLHHCPVVACLAGIGPFLPGSLSLDAAFNRAFDAGADAVGLVDCGSASEISHALASCSSPPAAVFPASADSPAAFAAESARLAAGGVHLIGGGSGVAAEHIAAAAARLSPPEAAPS